MKMKLLSGGSSLVPRGGLGGNIFTLQAGETKTLVFALTPDVRAWLKSHPRTSLIIAWGPGAARPPH